MSKENILDGDLHFERIGTMPSKLYFGIKSSSLHPLFVLFFKAYENQLEEVSLTWFFFLFHFHHYELFLYNQKYHYKHLHDKK